MHGQAEKNLNPTITYSMVTKDHIAMHTFSSLKWLHSLIPLAV